MGPQVMPGPATMPPSPLSGDMGLYPGTAQPAPPGALQPPRGGGEARVALLLPLSGRHAEIGQGMLQAAQLALFEVAGESFTLMPYDTRGTAEGAAAAAQRALQERAELILGPLLAEEVRAVSQQTAGRGVATVAFSNSRNVAGDGTFILGFVPRDQVETVVDYAVANNLRRIALLAPNDAYGGAVRDALQAAAAARGAGVARMQFYPAGGSDFTPEVKLIAEYDARRQALQRHRAELAAAGDEASRQALRRLENADTYGDPGYDAILLPGTGQELRGLVALLSFFDVDQPQVRFLGLRNWDEVPNLWNEPALVGAWYAAPPPEERQKFVERYQRVYGRAPARLASLAYDATALAAVLAQSPGGPDFSFRALTNPNGFIGVDGLFRLRADGVAERSFAIMQVRRGDSRPLRNASDTFQGLIN